MPARVWLQVFVSIIELLGFFPPQCSCFFCHNLRAVVDPYSQIPHHHPLNEKFHLYIPSPGSQLSGLDIPLEQWTTYASSFVLIYFSQKNLLRAYQMDPRISIVVLKVAFFFIIISITSAFSDVKSFQCGLQLSPPQPHWLQTLLLICQNLVSPNLPHHQGPPQTHM